MKRRLIKISLGIGATLVVALVSLAATAAFRWDRTFDVPLPDVRASIDPEVIARGRYLAYGPAACVDCHTAADQHEALRAGAMPPLTGGFEWKLPVGTIRTPNLTPDPETGIGRYSDGQLARMLRHGVRPDGRAAFPFMEYQQLSDEDLVAVISFLRSQPPVRRRAPESELNLAGKALMALVIEPVGPSRPPASRAPAAGPTPERGEYLVSSVANCAACHTARNLVDGSYTGERLAGGSPTPSDQDPDIVLTPPNLTPDPATGHIAGWSEEQFLRRFRAGPMVEGSHMPWASFGRMTDDDLRAIYRYLRTVEPVSNPVTIVARRPS